MDNRYVLITGGTSGIGYALAKVFAQNKYNLIIVARKEEELEECKKALTSYNVKVQTFAKDLSDRGETFTLCEELEASGFRIDILVNDAGQGLYGEFKNTDIRDDLYLLDLNVAAVVILTKYCLRKMLEKGSGKILNLGSIAGKLPGPWQAVYHGTKAFIILFSEAIREEVKDKNITVTVLMPGATDTDFFNKAGMQQSKLVQDKDALSDPTDVAREGFTALMDGKDKIIYGMKNKWEVGMSNFMPDEEIAHRLYEQQKPANKK